MSDLSATTLTAPASWLITRPTPQAERTAAALRAHGFGAVVAPLVTIAPRAVTKAALAPLAHCDGIIAVSANAVRLADARLSEYGRRWPACRYYAIGAATRAAFAEVHGYPVLSADPATTEGLLTHPGLRDLTQQHWCILRGLGGRETLAETLQQRGAQIDYIELYVRRPKLYSEEIHRELITQWQQQRVNGVIITSSEILMHFYHLISSSASDWGLQLTLVVPSRRIADHAVQYGFSRILIANGASDQALIATLLAHREKGL